MNPTLSAGQQDDQATFSGERFLPGYKDGSIELEHVHRYTFALPLVLDRVVVDIACGEGYGSDLLAQAARTVIGLDIDEQTVSTAHRRYRRNNLNFGVADASAIPLKSGSVDVIVSFETIEHFDDHHSFWSEIKRVLTTDGLLIISSPNRETYAEQRSAHNPFHKRELTERELKGSLCQRFRHHRLFSQSIAFGSLLLPQPGAPGPLVSVSLDPTTRVLAWKIGKEWNHPYSVALASEQPIQDVSQSIYNGRYPPSALSALMGGITERDQLARELRNRIIEMEQQTTEKTKLLTSERDHALSELANAQRQLHEFRELALDLDQAKAEAARLKEILHEQDGMISAMKKLWGELGRG